MMYIPNMHLPKYIGVYSHNLSRQTETGKSLYFVWETPEGNHLIQQVDGTFKPKGELQSISAEELAIDFQLQPRMQVAPAIPFSALQSSLSTVDGAQACPNSDPDELAQSVEATLRDNFRRAMLRLKRPRERQAAIGALEQLASVTENITPVHKHMFRDFGVNLRRNDMPDLALLFGKRVLELAPDDDHAHFNFARILCALGAYNEAAAHVRTAIRLDKDERIYSKMLLYLQKEKKKLGKSGRTRRGGHKAYRARSLSA